MRAYAEGVNAGLQALRVRPPEYLMLRAKPAPWQPEDSYLANYAMFAALHDVEGWNDYHESILRAAFPPAALAFFNAPDVSLERGHRRLKTRRAAHPHTAGAFVYQPQRAGGSGSSAGARAGGWIRCFLGFPSGPRSSNPKPETRNPKEIRRPKPEPATFLVAVGAD